MIGAMTNSAPSHVSEYIAVFITLGGLVAGWMLRRVISSLDNLHKEASTNSAGLAVLVERISPVQTELATHDTRLRNVENGQARLEGALETHRQWVQHAVDKLPASH